MDIKQLFISILLLCSNVPSCYGVQSYEDIPSNGRSKIRNDDEEEFFFVDPNIPIEDSNNPGRYFKLQPQNKYERKEDEDYVDADGDGIEEDPNNFRGHFQDRSGRTVNIHGERIVVAAPLVQRSAQESSGNTDQIPTSPAFAALKLGRALSQAELDKLAEQNEKQSQELPNHTLASEDDEEPHDESPVSLFSRHDEQCPSWRLVLGAGTGLVVTYISYKVIAAFHRWYELQQINKVLKPHGKTFEMLSPAQQNLLHNAYKKNRTLVNRSLAGEPAWLVEAIAQLYGGTMPGLKRAS